jgi:hypothetical protein
MNRLILALAMVVMMLGTGIVNSAVVTNVSYFQTVDVGRNNSHSIANFFGNNTPASESFSVACGGILDTANYVVTGNSNSFFFAATTVYYGFLSDYDINTVLEKSDQPITFTTSGPATLKMGLHATASTYGCPYGVVSVVNITTGSTIVSLQCDDYIYHSEMGDGAWGFMIPVNILLDANTQYAVYEDSHAVYWGHVSTYMVGDSAFIMSIHPATPYTWASNSDGKWSTLSNWSGSVPSGQGVVAQFTGDKSATVIVDNPVTLGQIVLDAGPDGTNYTLSGSAITLDNNCGTSDGALIDVVSGKHSISSPVILDDDTTISGHGTLTCSNITGNHSLTVLGNLTASSIEVDTLTIGSTGTHTVPEPSTIVLLFVASLGGLLWWRRRR